MGSFGNILAHYKDNQVRGPPRGYFLEPTNIILVVSPWNVASAEEFFRVVGLTVVTGSRYFGGFIGDRDADTTWLYEKVQGWTELLRTLSGVACKNLQSAYPVL